MSLFHSECSYACSQQPLQNVFQDFHMFLRLLHAEFVHRCFVIISMGFVFKCGFVLDRQVLCWRCILLIMFRLGRVNVVTIVY